MGPLAYPSEPGGGTRSLTGDCEVVGCREPTYQRVVRDLGVGQAESRLVCRGHLAAALAWAAQPPPRSSLPATSARGGGIGLRPEFRAPRQPPKPARTARPPRAAQPSSSGEGPAAERSAVPVEAQAEPPAVAVAGSEEAGRGLPAPEPLAAAGGQPTSTPDPWDGPEGRIHSEPQEAPVARAATLPPVDPAAPPGRCRLQGCPRPSRCRGLCRYCHNRVLRAGRIEELGAPRKGAGGRRPRPIDPREVPAPESAPSTRPQRAPRTRRAAPPPPETEALQAIWAALGSPSGLSPSEPLELLRATEQRLRLDALLSSRILELEADGVRLREQLLRLQGERRLEDVGSLRALHAIGEQLSDAIWRSARIQGGVADTVPRLLKGLTQIGLALGVPEGEGLEAILATAREVPARTQALDVARRQAVAALETPESLERRYQALQTARRLRDLLEGRAETRVQLPTGEIVGLQEIWLWDLLAPLLPGEIERLEREAGVSRG